MSISVPPSSLPPSSPLGPMTQPPQASGEDGVPGETNMLMALAEMHRMGRTKAPKPKATR